jgi:hypothetical protein
VTGPTQRRLALIKWWVDAYTRTAPPDAAEARRAEMESDLFEEIAEATARAESGWRLRRRMTSRFLRGIPADVAWRLGTEYAPGRLRWHLEHPSTVLNAAGTVLIPMGILADWLRRGTNEWGPAGALGAIWLLACALLLGFSAVSLHAVIRSAPPIGRVTLAGRRRGAFAAMSLLGSLSAVWRFAPEPLTIVSTFAWAGFGLAFLGFLLLSALSVARLLVPPDFGKLSS